MDKSAETEAGNALQKQLEMSASGHVTATRFEEEVRAAAAEAGLKPAEQPLIWRSRTVLPKKEG